MIALNHTATGQIGIAGNINFIFTLGTNKLHNININDNDRIIAQIRIMSRATMITPQNTAPNLAKTIGLNAELFFKREDLHPLGSHKGRSIPLMIEKYAANGARDFVISSSGNAALAAVRAITGFNTARGEDPLKLIVYLGKNIDADKLKLISEAAGNDGRVLVKQVNNPKQEAFLAEKDGRVKNIRQSTDDSALAGYEELARELAEIVNLSAVFIPTSSGTTAEGLFAGFKKLGLNPAIYVVQTPACHPFISGIGEDTETPSIATAIVDHVAHRLARIKTVIAESNGGGWIADNEEITTAMAETKREEGLDISPNSALSIAGLKKCVQSGRTFAGPVVCLITGK